MHSSLLALLVAVPTLFAAPALFSAPSGLIDAVKIAVNDAVDGTVGADDGDLIPDKWIVNLEDATSKEFARTVISVANGILQTREFSLEGFLGFALDGNFEDITALIEQLPGIKNIEQDRYIAPHDFVSQSDVNWGLARVSDQSSDEYFYDESGGEGTYAYIVDSVSMALISSSTSTADRCCRGSTLITSNLAAALRWRPTSSMMRMMRTLLATGLTLPESWGPKRTASPKRST